MYNPEEIVPCLGVFDSKRDRKSVDQVGFIDLRKTFESGSIPGNASFLDEHCNGVVDPEDMMYRPKDNFERMRQAEYVKSALKSVPKTESKESTPEGEK